MKSQEEHRQTNEKHLTRHRGIELYGMTENKRTWVEGIWEQVSGVGCQFGSSVKWPRWN